ncbi:hypothetical protein OsJ_10681 [Oryza sativa Japonica Group]|uniref:Uncharacterized protein n=1 Tax=Oryza sativa subsp. japonica TaxID=39947 RepID=B9F881_ORYSJ|nr:hypothetical protein OsJ_10681 [Oryza sativa Japonica Group]
MAHMFRIQCRASDVLRLTIVNGEVILGKSDPRDDRQARPLHFPSASLFHRLRHAHHVLALCTLRQYGLAQGRKIQRRHQGRRQAVLPSALVNKATAMPSNTPWATVALVIKFEPGYLDESVLWTASVDVADGYRRIHMMNNADYIFDAEEDTPQYGGARDGTRLILFRWNEGLNQIWRMVPCGGGVLEHEKPLRVVCHSNQALFLSVRDGVVVLADIDIKSRRQWIVSFQNTGRVTDAEGHRSFVLVNWSSGKVMKRSGDGEPVSTKPICTSACTRRGSPSPSPGMEHAFRIQCRASDDLSLAIVNGEVWHKDVRYSAGLKDEAGRLAFALVNKATGEAIKHSFGYNHPVRLVKFEPGYLDESVLWTESEDTGDGFHRIHMINNADYIFDAEEAVPLCDGARDGTRLILFRWNGGDNQLWRMAPCIGAEPDHEPPVHVVCLTVRHGAVVLARIDHKDPKQHWTVSFRNTGRVTDEEGHRSFLLLNPSTGKAMKRSADKEQPVELVGHGPDSVDVALLWTRSDNVGEGFHCIRTVSDVSLVLDAAGGGRHDGTPIIVFPWNGGANQRWSMLPLD